MPDISRYAIDNTSERAGSRYHALETAYDPATCARLTELGVAPAMRCLEVGGGGGSVAAWLAERVGPEGSVLATDIQPRRPDGSADHANLRVVRHDTAREELPEGHLRERLTEDALTHDDLDRCVRLLEDPAFVVNSHPLITTWGRRP
jgi:tRNA A58 N-methylase Trm61